MVTRVLSREFMLVRVQFGTSNPVAVRTATTCGELYRTRSPGTLPRSWAWALRTTDSQGSGRSDGRLARCASGRGSRDRAHAQSWFAVPASYHRGHHDGARLPEAVRRQGPKRAASRRGEGGPWRELRGVGRAGRHRSDRE